jgi:O-succinylbenzoic acid--CoA ligase
VATPGQEFERALEAAWASGAAVLPLDPSAPAAHRDAVVAAMRPEVPLEDDDCALVVATSGSTGAPKGVRLSRAALEASARATVDRLGAGSDDVWLSCLPWHHVAGLQVLLRARLTGAGLVVHERFDPDRLAAERTATVVSLVPTQLVRLLDAGVPLDGYRAVLLGGAAASATLLGRARDAGVPVVTTYGMTETCGGCVYDGAPLDGVEVRTSPDGLVEIRGPMLMSGYRLRPDLTEGALVDGWLRTSDLGAWDGSRLVVRGRADDVIVSGGENVAAGDVARVLCGHRAVGDAVVVGAPDHEWGQRVVAVVALEGSLRATADELRVFVRERLPAPAVPRDVLVVDAVPLLPTGKPDVQAARALVERAQAAPAVTGTSQSAEPPSLT